MAPTKLGSGEVVVDGTGGGAGALARFVGEGGSGMWIAAGAVRMVLIAYAVWHDSSCERIPALPQPPNA